MSEKESDLVSDLKILEGNLKFIDVGFCYLCAERKLSQEPASPTFCLEILVQPLDEVDENALVRVRIAIRVEVPVQGGKMTTTPYADFEIDREFFAALNHKALTAFANNQVVYDLLPYVRESLCDLSIRTFKKQILMPHFKKDELQFPFSERDNPENMED